MFAEQQTSLSVGRNSIIQRPWTQQQSFLMESCDWLRAPRLRPISRPVPEEGRGSAKRWRKSVDSWTVSNPVTRHTISAFSESIQIRFQTFNHLRHSGGSSGIDFIPKTRRFLVFWLQFNLCLLLEWNMATTETQLMLSVGLIGKFVLIGSFPSVIKVYGNLNNLSWRFRTLRRSHDTSVTQICFISRSRALRILQVGV